MPTHSQVPTGGPSEPSPPPAVGTAGATAAGEGADGAGGAESEDLPPIAESHITVEPTTGIQPEPNPSESLKRHREEGSRVVLPGQGYAGSWQPSADPQTPHQLLQTGWEAAVATAAAATHTATTAPPPAARSRSSPSLQIGQLNDAEQAAPKPGGGGGGGAERSRPRNALERREWTTEEDDIIRSGVKQFGYRWRRIASLPQLQGRSDDAVRNRWSRLKGGGEGGTTTASAPEEAAAAAAPGQADRGGEGGEGGAKGDGSGPDAAPPPVRRRSSTGSAGEDGGGGGAKRERIGWTQAEDAIIISTVREIGHKWYRIAQRIPGRTEHAIRNRWQRLLRMVEDTQPPPLPSLFQAVGGAGPEEPAR